MHLQSHLPEDRSFGLSLRQMNFRDYLSEVGKVPASGGGRTTWLHSLLLHGLRQSASDFGSE